MDAYKTSDCLQFQHSEEQLISMLRQMKGEGKYVIERELYGPNATPWDVLKDEDPWQHVHDSGKKKSTIYVLTELKKVKRQSKNYTRIAGKGTWHGHTGKQEVTNDRGQPIGCKRTFSFICKEGKDQSEIKKKGHWTMHEYSLRGISSEGQVNSDFVICKITRDYSKSPKFSNRNWPNEEVEVADREDQEAYLCGDNDPVQPLSRPPPVHNSGLGQEHAAGAWEDSENLARDDLLGLPIWDFNELLLPTP